MVKLWWHVLKGLLLHSDATISKHSLPFPEEPGAFWRTSELNYFFFFRILFCCVIRFWSLYLIFFLFYKKTQLLKNMLKNRIIHPFVFYNLFVFNACMFSFFGIRYIFQWIFSKGFQTSMHKINLNPTSQKVSEVPSVLVWDIELL